MPEISRFLGIVIQMYRDDHPPPHFHAIYGEFSAQISIRSPSIIKGRLPARVLGYVTEWACSTKQNWCAAGKPRKRTSQSAKSNRSSDPG